MTAAAAPPRDRRPRQHRRGLATWALAVAVLAGCGPTEPAPPVSVQQELVETVELTADLPIAMIPVTVAITPGTKGAAGYGRNEYGFVELPELKDGATLTAISTSGAPQPRAWSVGQSVMLPELTSGALRSQTMCVAPATCTHPYRLLLEPDEPAELDVDWRVRAATSFAPGSDTSQTRVDITRTGDVEHLPVPKAVSDIVADTVTLDSSAAVERLVRLRYTGPTPNAWPLRAEAIVRTTREDDERLPLTQLDLFATVGPGGPRIFADYVGPNLSIDANLFDGCAAGVPCERYLRLHFYPVPGSLKIDWDVEVRVRDYETGLPPEATVDATLLADDEIAGIARCAPEPIIDYAAVQGIVDDAEEARQLALVAADDWTAEELGGADVVKSFCNLLTDQR